MSSEQRSNGLLRIVLVVLGVIIVFPLLMMVFAMPMMGMMGLWWGGNMTGGLSPLWGIGMMFVWLIILIGIGYLIYRGLVGGIDSSIGNNPALEELREAYARGDISDEEFEKRHKKLKQKKTKNN